MADVPFPRTVKFAGFQPVFSGQIRGRQEALSGAESIIPSFSGRWTASAPIMLVYENARTEWRGFMAQMEGGIGVSHVPIMQQHRPRLADGRVPEQYSSPAFAAFEHWSFVSDPVARVTLAADAAVRATDLQISLVDCLGLRPGHYLSIASRLYQVQLSWADGASNYIRVRPPLREAAVTGAALELDNPICQMRLSSEDTGNPSEGLTDVDRVEVAFREAI